MDFNLTEEDRAIQETTRQFTRKEIIPVAGRYDDTMEYPWEVMEKAHATGLVNVSVPEDLGGLGLSHLQQVIINSELAYGCSGMSTALTINELALGPLLEFGTKEQLNEFVPPMLEDYRQQAAYCVTEPGAGSDVQAIRTTARRAGDEYVMNGEKMWISNASVAKWFYVLATTDPGAGHKAMCAFVIPSDLKGIEIGKKEINCGQRCSDTRGIRFNDVKIPKRYLLGAEGMGFKIAMRAFDKSRPGVGAGALGVLRRCLDESVRYAQQRETFGRPIGQHQAVQFMLADMAVDAEAAQLLVWKSAKLLDESQRNTKHASFAKCFAGDAAVRAATNAVQIFGGYGYNKEYPVEKLYRDAKIFQIYEGTQQIQRLIIGRYLLEENRI